jgi:protein-S-isoprenylcysteine O-methyltransferase Ste14
MALGEAWVGVDSNAREAAIASLQHLLDDRLSKNWRLTLIRFAALQFPIRWVVAQFLVMTSWVALTPKGRKLTDSTLGRVAAAALMSAGAAAALSGSIMLGKSLSPFPKPPAHAQFIRRGAYAAVRQPVHAGLIALSLGWACLWGSARGAAPAPVQATSLDVKARREERWLREKFPNHGQYAAKVPRLIPWIY